MRRNHWCLLILLLLNAVQTPAETDNRQLDAAYIEFPPLSYTDEDGEPSGSYIRKVNELADHAGYTIRWQSLPIDRIYLYLEEGRIDVWLGSSDVPALSEWTHEPDFTFPPIALNAYYIKGTPRIENMDDLKGESLILIRGYTYLDQLSPITDHPDTRVGKAPGHESALRMLKVGRGDYLVNFANPVRTALQNEPLPGLRQTQLMEWDTSLVFSKHTEGLERIIRDFERAWESTNKH